MEVIPVLAENRRRPNPPAAKKAVGIFEEFSLDELMSRSAKIISEFIVAHQDELGLNDYQAMLNRELAGKKRSSVVSALQALLQ